jgi:hypothetical protein
MGMQAAQVVAEGHSMGLQGAPLREQRHAATRYTQAAAEVH